jgi:polysaccharide export outer membrane protein
MTSSFCRKAIRLIQPIFLATGLLVLGGGCSTPTASSFPDQPAAAATSSDPTLLVPGDVIKLEFPGAPELSQQQRIRPDGRITLPIIGEIAAAGETFVAFQKELEAKYNSQLKNSEVLISLDSSSTRTITVDGFVRGAGTIPCEHPMTAFEAIMMAGGFTEDADMKKVQVIRMINGQDRSVFVDLRAAMRGNPAPALKVQAGDIIYVPEKLF